MGWFSRLWSAVVRRFSYGMPNGTPSHSNAAGSPHTAISHTAILHTAILYTRPGCCLCDEALALLKRFEITPESVNIDEDPLLQEKYGTCIPVVVIDGEERFRGRVNEVLLRRLLRKR